MKTCVILEIKDKKAIVLFPDGEISEVRAKSDWAVGQTVSLTKEKKIARPQLVAVACVFLICVAITPFALGQSGIFDDEFDTAGGVNHKVVGSPTVVASALEIADSDYENVFDKLDASSNDIIASERKTTTIEKPPLNLAESDGAASTTPEIKANEAAPIEDSVAPKSKDYSDTNIQELGINEADIIKTDGEFIFALNSENLVVLLANNGNPQILAKIKQESDKNQYYEMYVENNFLVVMKTSADSEKEEEFKPMTIVEIFDISNPEKPEMIKTVSQSGYYKDSRMSNNFLYLISEYTPVGADIERKKPETFLPKYSNGQQETVCEAKDITICPVDYSDTYLVIGSIDVGSENIDFVDKKNILGASGELYMSSENIYVATESYDSIMTKEKGITAETNSSQITKINYKNGKLRDVKSTKVPGSIKGQFFMDEYKGTFRVVTEAYWNGQSTKKPSGYEFDSESYDYEGIYYLYGEYTALFTLDKDLKQLGKIINIAPGETLYSCRFMDDYAYFVTFKQVDPLFTADLSDPKNPQLVGELKIPGFSEYMHPYDDGLLFGIGNDADEDTGRAGSIKLSMFDNSNPENITEKHTFIVDGYDYTEVAENHKAILVNSDKKLIAFPTEGSYLLFTYDEKKGFKQIAKMSYGNEYSYMENAIRGLYIDDDFYVITPNIVKTFDMTEDYKEKSRLRINTNAEPVSSKGLPYNPFPIID